MIYTRIFNAFLAAAMLTLATCLTVPSAHGDTLSLRQDSGEKLVFCHFMVSLN